MTWFRIEFFEVIQGHGVVPFDFPRKVAADDIKRLELLPQNMKAKDVLLCKVDILEVEPIKI